MGSRVKRGMTRVWGVVFAFVFWGCVRGVLKKGKPFGAPFFFSLPFSFSLSIPFSIPLPLSFSLSGFLGFLGFGKPPIMRDNGIFHRRGAYYAPVAGQTYSALTSPLSDGGRIICAPTGLCEVWSFVFWGVWMWCFKKGQPSAFWRAPFFFTLLTLFINTFFNTLIFFFIGSVC